MKILIVDHSRAMRLLVKRTLRQAGLKGHDIAEAGNGVEALEVIAGSAPDLVLSDWNMPEMNGIELLRSLRAAGNNVKLGFVTSEGTPEIRHLASNEGASFLIAKPFNSDAIEQALTPHLSIAKRAPRNPRRRRVMAAKTVPSLETARALLADLIGRAVKATPATARAVGVGPQAVAVYARSDGSPGAACVFDLGAASATGAALMMMPAGAARECAANGELVEAVLDGFHEVVNVSARLFNDTGAEHVQLSDVHAAPAAVPSDIATTLAAAHERLDMDIDVAGYGVGYVAFISLAL